jgi:ABC-2 type transport system ATP-binding protein
MVDEINGADNETVNETVVEVSGLSKTFYVGFLPYKWPHRMLERISPRVASVFARKVGAVQNLSFEVRKAEIFGLLGPNGAGKTTTLKLMMGLLFADKGVVRLFGRPVGDLRAKKRIGFLPENPYFYDYLKPREFLDLVARLTDVDGRKREQRIQEMLELTGLTHALDLPLRKFSKGMLQRIGVAQALINDPELVVLDEPLSGLDPVGRKEMRDVIQRLARRGKTVLFSSHILSDVELICDRVAIMVSGKLSSVGPLSDLLTSDVDETEVVLADVDPDLERSLKSTSDWAVNRSGSRVQVTLPGSGQTEKLLETALKGGAKVVSVLPGRRSLEDLFMAQALKSPEGETKDEPESETEPERRSDG